MKTPSPPKRMTRAAMLRAAQLDSRNRAIAFLLCWVLVVAAALAVVTLRHQNRQAFVALLQAENEKSELQFEHGRLLLERATWARRNNIVTDARARLNMDTPAPNKIITLSLIQGEEQ